MENKNEFETPKNVAVPPKRVIRLDDLDNDEEVIGGAGEKLFFGEQTATESPFKGLFGGSGK